ncbi:MAG: hypothetical protein JJE09_01085 [Bacteroidia bacterium]|nr:hypothetical protein [Bacteroidia bacterium]
MRKLLFFGFFWLSASLLIAQQLVFPDRPDWNVLAEGEELNFFVTTTDSIMAHYSLEGAEDQKIQFDSLGHFFWQPVFGFVSRLEKQKQIVLIFQGEWSDGRRVREQITFTVYHKNRPPSVEDLPVFYVRQSTSNRYQIPSEYVIDPDGDPLVFKTNPSQLPEGVNLSSLGLLTWTPSRNQFNSLKNNPLTLEFVAQDQPHKAESTGKIKIAQTQLDLPPEMLLVPGDTIVTAKEDQLINFKVYTSDPNGDENISSVGFISSDARIPNNSLKENSSVQHEFTWTPGYDFVEEVEKSKNIVLTFFAIDKSSNRVQRKVTLKILDTENLDEKDKLLYLKYRASLVQAKAMIDQLDENHDKLTKAYKQAKKGKKNRSILNASLGATTGLSPVAFANDPGTYKTVSAIGGTTVLTMGTLEATEVIGKSKSDILEKMKINVEIRNQLQIEGDNFARKNALKSARRSKEFDADRDKLLPIINNQKLVILELDASRSSNPKLDNKAIKKTFPDFSEE